MLFSSFRPVMQNGTLDNGSSEHHNDGQLDGNNATPVDSQPQAPSPKLLELSSANASKDPEWEDNKNDGPPPKKRKLTGSATPQPSTAIRPVSPPWKRIAVDGPTSFVEGGRRKSSRTNFLPLELQPQADKRQTRAAIHKTQLVGSKYGGASITKPPPSTHSLSQAQINGKRPQPSGKSIANTFAKSSAKTGQSSDTSTKQAATAITATSIKRSHKKLPPKSPPQSPRSPQNTGPLQTRRSGRASTSIVRRGRVQGMATNGWHGSDEDQAAEEDIDEEIVITGPKYKPQRLSLKVRMPTVTIQHPEHVPLSRRFSSFQEWVEQEGSRAPDNSGQLTDEEASKEARLRRRILQAAQPGGVLSEGKCSVYVPEPQEEPPQQYAHRDHLLAHAIYFRKLIVQEQEKHKRNARRIAYAAAVEWQSKQPKTQDQIWKEQEKLSLERYKQVRTDLRQKWGIVTAEVRKRRLERWKEEQHLLGRKALNELLEQSTQLLDKRRRRHSSDIGSDEEADSEEDGAHAEGSQNSASDAESGDEENMSTSEPESEESQTVTDDEGLSNEELRRKYSIIENGNLDRSLDPGKENSEAIGVDLDTGKAHKTRMADRSNSDAVENSGRAMTPMVVDEVDDVLMDNSDESTDMDDDSADSDEDARENDGEDSDAASEEPGLLGFFSKKEFLADAATSTDPNLAPINGTGEASEEEVEEVSLIPDATQVQTPSASNSEEPYMGAHKTPKDVDKSDASKPTLHARDTETTPSVKKPQIPQSALANLVNADSVVHNHQDSLPTTPVSANAIITPVPSLLRGALREYQYHGLDWLAKLYRENTNGILADEMGLGKTIQTISLLAHLAERHEVWGPHLIVVPTSVMLNWEMEFKKFLPGFKVLTYYGTQEERRKKRMGWMDDDKWNVWITSYQLISQDNQIFKRKAWHYMVLDEAHNIKNFRSKRWQTMLTFRTHSRLLLTGTPLQNNLTELWSLLYFLMPPDSPELQGFGDMVQFNNWFRNPVDQIMEGKEVIDQEGKNDVARLHKILRPHLLRRLKADVEKQMPGKTEYVLYCKLSKRQRYLYDGFMSRAQTRETLATGNFLKIINCLMQLRKVCNHPDLFETRQIVTSFAMSKSAVADFEIKELLVRQRLLYEDPISTVDLDVVNLLPGTNEHLSALDTIQKQRLGAIGTLRQLTSHAWGRIGQGLQFDGTSIKSALASMENNARRSRFEELRHSSYLTSLRSQRRPLYSYSLMDRLKMDIKTLPSQPMPVRRAELSDWFSRQSPALAEMVLELPRRSKAMEPIIQKFACVTPAVVATDMVPLALSQSGVEVVRSAHQQCSTDAFHEARMRLSIAFPDKRLLQYDCGKLQRLDSLLRKLQEGGHRSLIFTQMTRVLDILEQFLNIHGHRYLRLDGQTRIEQRQILTERFNSDTRIDVFILSSRSGGLGINLTGADTVIFYDSDWNPAMDKQCQDRCHRIGQTRDVSIYRLVSEYTIEANILRKANQKRRLDDIVIQDGTFTTEYFNKPSASDELIGEEALDGDADANAAMDRVFGDAGAGRLFDAVEDAEDIAAAKSAEKEIINTDAADFDDKAAAGGSSGGGGTPKTPGPTTPGDLNPPPSTMNETSNVERSTILEVANSCPVTPSAAGGVDEQDDEDGEEPGHIDEYMLGHVEWEFRDVAVVDPDEKMRKKRNRTGGGEHRVRRKR